MPPRLPPQPIKQTPLRSFTNSTKTIKSTNKSIASTDTAASLSSQASSFPFQYDRYQQTKSALERHLHDEPVPVQVKNWSCVALLLFSVLTIFYVCMSLSAGKKMRSALDDLLDDEDEIQEEPLSLRCIGGETKDATSVIALTMNPLGCFIHWLGCISFTKAVDLAKHRDPDYRMRHIHWYMYSMAGPVAAIFLEFCLKVEECNSSGLFWTFTLFEMAGTIVLLFWGWRLAKLFLHWLHNPECMGDCSDDEVGTPPYILSNRDSPKTLQSTVSALTTTEDDREDYSSDIVTLPPL